jgi:trehalose-phosphatase
MNSTSINPLNIVVPSISKSDSHKSSRLFIVTYHLPITLRRRIGTKKNGSQWECAWVEDDILARTPNSIAGDIRTVWIGVVTRECIDSKTWEEEVVDDANINGTITPQTQKSASSNTEDDTTQTPFERETDEINSNSLPKREGFLRSLTYAFPTESGSIRVVGDSLVQSAMSAAASTSSTTGVTPLSDDKPVSVSISGMRASQFGSTNASPSTGKLTFTPEEMEDIARTLNAIDVAPIFLPTELHESFSSYCLSVLRPALCNVLETGTQRLFPYASSLAYQSAGYAAFERANEAVAKVIADLYIPNDIVWTHDFPLSLVPRYIARWGLKALGSRPLQVFFFHSPFPTSEIFRTIHVRDELLTGILECDVVGFHTFNYARHFLHACKRLRGFSHRSRRGGSLAVDVDGRDVLVSTSHVGVEAAALDRWMAGESAARTARMFADRHPGKIIIAGIDSCQRLSGIALKLLAFERLLEENPVYRQQVVLVQRCELRYALSADAIHTSQELRSRVTLINSTYGPVIDYEEALSYSPGYRVGLFHRADILLQTPIREGLNLLPLEYVYVRTQWQISRSKSLTSFEPQISELEVDGKESQEKEQMRIKNNTGASRGLTSFGLTIGSPIGMTTPIDLSEVRSIPRRRAQSASEAYGMEGVYDESTILSMNVPAHENSVNANKPSRAPSGLSDAALKAITIGMPSHYATISASTQKARVAFGDIFGSADLSDASSKTSTQPAPIVSPMIQSISMLSTSPEGSTNREPELVPKSISSLKIPDCLVSPLPPPSRGGCVILSEFSTATSVLNSNLVVNPWNIKNVAHEIDKALLMEDHERSFRQWRDYQYAIRNPAAAWSRACISDVVELRADRTRLNSPDDLTPIPQDGSDITSHTTSLNSLQSASALERSPVPLLDADAVSSAFMSATSCLILIDIGGTLVSQTRQSSVEARTSKLHGFSLDGYSEDLPSDVSSALVRIANDKRVSAYVVSGLQRSEIEALRVADDLKLGIAAENGMFVSHPSLSTTRSWDCSLLSDGTEMSQWKVLKERAALLMTDYSWRVNSSAVFSYESLIAWDFKNADPEWASIQARFVAQELEQIVSELSSEKLVKVSVRKSRVELCLRSINKGSIALKALEHLSRSNNGVVDFVLCIGDDSTDEDMFAAVSEWTQKQEVQQSEYKRNVFNVTVGKKKSTKASFWLSDSSKVQDLVKGLL